jgi:DNA-binding CsgD family transcriptional regulator
VRELAEVSRPEALPISGPAFSAETAAVIRARLGGAIPEMIEAISHGVPGHASRTHPDYHQRLVDAVTGAVACFITHVARPDQSIRPITAEFRAIGGAAAREGRTLDALQDALRLGARVAWRWLCEADAGLDRRELSRVGEAIFAYLDELAAACAQGYAEARLRATGDRQRRLLAAIVSDPPSRAELVASLARTAGWVLPDQVALVVLGQRQQDGLLLPPGVLADWTGPEPCLLVPDPDGPGRQAAIDRALSDRALGGRPAAIGPSVPLARAAMSLRWARHALALARAGVIPAGPVRCDQHLSTLLILADEDLAAVLRGRRLAPLARLRPGQRDRIAETLLAWLQLGENAAEVAQRLHVHPQTVRYRMRQIRELFGDQLRDPDRRFELQLALRIRTLSGSACQAKTPGRREG